MNSIHSSALNGSSDSSAESVNSSVNRSEEAQRFSSGSSNPEVLAIKRRRTISPAEKRRILQAYDRCKTAAERGAVLRRERVYSSMLSGWRKHDRAALATPRRGPKANPAVAQRNRDALLTREIVRLRRQLERAHLIIDAQKKLCALLGLPTAEEQEALDK
jgi:transposase-like protein